MGAARPARMVDVVVAVGRNKLVACKLLAFANDASAAASYHGNCCRRLFL